VSTNDVNGKLNKKLNRTVYYYALNYKEFGVYIENMKASLGKASVTLA